MSAVLRAFAEMARHTCPERPTAAEDAATHDRLCDLMAPAKAEWERLLTALDEARRATEAQDEAVAAHEHEQTVTIAAVIRERDEARRERDAARVEVAALKSGVCDRCHERLHRAMDAEDALATLREAASAVLRDHEDGDPIVSV